MDYKKGFKREYYSATLAELAYITDFKILQKELMKIGFYMRRKGDMFSFDEMDGFVAVCDEGLVMAFRGTEFEPENLFQDWRINFDFGLIDIEIEGKTIKNVAKGYGERIEKYWHKLKDMIWCGNPLFTGHSAGGGYAPIMARAYRDVTGDKFRCFPHAGPRITNTHHFLPEQYYTINSSDIVPRVPLNLMDRRHTGKLIYFNRKGKYIKTSKIERIVKFVLNIRRTLKNHYPNEYEKVWLDNWFKIEAELEKDLKNKS